LTPYSFQSNFRIFCFLRSSISYLYYQRYFRCQKDRLHPFKRFRPIAHGDIPVLLAMIIAAFLLAISLSAATLITPAFFLLVLVYLGMQFLYSSFLKSVAVIDILLIAAGYIFAGLCRGICQRLSYLGLAFVNDNFYFAFFSSW